MKEGGKESLTQGCMQGLLRLLASELHEHDKEGFQPDWCKKSIAQSLGGLSSHCWELSTADHWFSILLEMKRMRSRSNLRTYFLKRWKSYARKRNWDIQVLRKPNSICCCWDALKWACFSRNKKDRDPCLHFPFSPFSPLPFIPLPFHSVFLRPQMNHMLHPHLCLSSPNRLESLASPFIGIAPVRVSNSSLVDYVVLYHMYLYTTPFTVTSPPWPQLSIIPPICFSQSACEMVTALPLLLFTWKLKLRLGEMAFWQTCLTDCEP